MACMGAHGMISQTFFEVTFSVVLYMIIRLDPVLNSHLNLLKLNLYIIYSESVFNHLIMHGEFALSVCSSLTF